MTAGPVVAPPIERKALYRVNEAKKMLSLSRSTVYELIRSGRLRTVKEGGARLVPAEAIAEYVALLEREAMADIR
ncbi:MAG: helix-turn-helix domain-containing protein [Actinoallomurus sp.]